MAAKSGSKNSSSAKMAPKKNAKKNVKKSPKKDSKKSPKKDSRKSVKKDVKKPKKATIKPQKLPEKLVDLTKTKDDVNEVLCAAVKNEPEETKFVIDKLKDSVVDVPLYKPAPRIKPRSVADLLDGLRCHGNLIPPSHIDSTLPKAAIEHAVKQDRREGKMKLKRLKSGVRTSKKETQITESFAADPWLESSGVNAKKRLQLTAPLPEDPIYRLPLSYNPNPTSESLRGVVKVAANVLTRSDRKKAKIEKVASAIRNAKPLSMSEQLAEMSAGLFDPDDSGVKSEDDDEHETVEKVTEAVKVSKKSTGRLTKQERKRLKNLASVQQSVQARKDRNRFSHDFYLLRKIKNEVAAIAARRAALQTTEAQKESSRKRKQAIWYRSILRRATIQAGRQREAAALVQRAPAAVIGDTDAGMELGKSLRLVEPRTKSLAFERLVTMQKKGMLLDYRQYESSRKAITARKRHGYKTFEISR